MHQGTLSHQTEMVVVPSGHRSGGVPSAVYDGYRLGLEGACVDVVIATRLVNGTPVVLASKRVIGKPFGGYWWMQGGAVQGYRSILDFLSERAEKECGLRPRIVGLVGFYRTCAEDGIASTMQPCYVATVPREAIEQAKADSDHSSWALFSLEDLEKLPPNEQHWYPMRVFRRVLESMA